MADPGWRFCDYCAICSAVRRSWVAVVALTILGALVGATVTFLQAPTYAASAQLFVSASPAAKTGTNLNQAGTDLNQAGMFVQNEVKSFSELITSPEVLEPV